MPNIRMGTVTIDSGLPNGSCLLVKEYRPDTFAGSRFPARPLQQQFDYFPVDFRRETGHYP